MFVLVKDKIYRTGQYINVEQITVILSYGREKSGCIWMSNGENHELDEIDFQKILKSIDLGKKIKRSDEFIMTRFQSFTIIALMVILGYVIVNILK